MNIRTFALVFGGFYALIGVLGFIPALVSPVPTGSAMSGDHGLLLGLFPVNVLHNLVHLAIGLWGLFVYKNFEGARLYARSLAVIFGVLALMGMVPGLRTTFGLIPLYSHDIWLHLITAVAGAYFGFMYPYRREDMEQHHRA